MKNRYKQAIYIYIYKTIHINIYIYMKYISYTNIAALRSPCNTQPFATAAPRFVLPRGEARRRANGFANGFAERNALRMALRKALRKALRMALWKELCHHQCINIEWAVVNK